MTKDRGIGVVKFWNQAKGWGAITSDLLPAGRNAWVLWSKVAMDGYTTLEAGQIVEFAFHAQKYESFDFVADFVRPIGTPAQ
ncbi:cold-shock protein [uncultured Jatrophihabitans sp.]|uniref:cold-shock protein n=1 Tax=uncultured Jatrophihabitans sp. TaxID=1610747 RepID=UPI0035C9FB4B